MNFNKTLSKLDEHYTAQDTYQYQTAIDVWRSLWNDLYPQGLPQLDSFLNTHGLEKTIIAYDRVATRIIQNVEHSYVVDHMVHTLGMRTTLFLYRFLKRFTFSQMDALIPHEESLFLSRNNRAKQLNRRTLSPYIHYGLKAIVDAIVPKNFCLPELDIFRDVPSGANAEGLRTKIGKAHLICAYQPFNRIGIGAASPKLSYTSIQRFVPKSLGKLRGICMEEVFRQYNMTKFQLGMERILLSKKSIYHPYGRLDINNQDRSRELAVIGSRDGSLSTIDLTAASDSHSYPVLDAVIPSCLSGWKEWVAHYFKFSRDTEKKHILHMPLTMGTRMTMAFQTWTFYIIACFAAKLCSAWCWNSRTQLKHYLDSIAIYGDDCIVHTDTAQTFIELLETLGYQVNHDKSFYTTDLLYREACGVEAYHGETVSTCYWPRGIFSHPDQLVSLQHRVYQEYGFLPSFYDAIQRANKWKISTTVDPDAFGLLSDSRVLSPARSGDVPCQGDIDLSQFVTERVSHARTRSNKPDFRDVETLKHLMQYENAIDLKSDAERLTYYEYLSHGPSYDDDLSQILKVSTQRDVSSLITSGDIPKVYHTNDWDIIF